MSTERLASQSVNSDVRRLPPHSLLNALILSFWPSLPRRLGATRPRLQLGQPAGVAERASRSLRLAQCPPPLGIVGPRSEEIGEAAIAIE